MGCRDKPGNDKVEGGLPSALRDLIGDHVMINWADIRKTRFSPERPGEWPEGVYAVSITGITLLGVHEKSGRLYWDGEEVVTRTKIRLGTLELWLVGIAAVGTFGSFLVEVGHRIDLWPN